MFLGRCCVQNKSYILEVVRDNYLFYERMFYFVLITRRKIINNIQHLFGIVPWRATFISPKEESKSSIQLALSIAFPDYTLKHVSYVISTTTVSPLV